MLEAGSEPELDDDYDLPVLATSNSVHDRTQFESKFDFELGLEGEKRYEIDLYLFFPKTLGVNSESYPREAFYGDLTHLMRVRTPEVKRPRGSVFKPPRLTSLDEYFANHLNSLKRQKLSSLVVHDVKLFGCLVYTELKTVQAQFARVCKRAQRGQRPDLVARFHDRLRQRVEGVHAAIRGFRQDYVWTLKNEPLLLDEEVRRALLLVDEYLSYRLESTLIALHRLAENWGEPLEDLLHQVEALLTGELAYRQSEMPEQQSLRAESHYYRLGLLKKYVGEVLFLQTQRINRDYLYRNFVAAFGAALAAFFATITNIQTTKMVLGQEDVGVRLVTVLVLGVLAYVFKDRIKDLSKDYFNSRLKSKLPDYDVEMHYTHFGQDGFAHKLLLGSSQEYVRYLQRSSLPPDIDYLREIGHRTELEPERLETALHYHKSIRFLVKEKVRDHLGQARVKRVHDVLRFDVSHFLAKLADPKKKLSFFHSDEGIVTIEAPKVYHLNLVFRYRVTEQGKAQQHEYERLRVVLNKQGIVRVETVIPRGELGFEEKLSA